MTKMDFATFISYFYDGTLLSPSQINTKLVYFKFNK